MATTPKTGPFTLDEFKTLWESTTDKSYWQPIEQAGEGNGFEVWTQQFTQFTRVSQAIDTSFQAMFIRPWSGQTNSPAQGAQNATVELVFTRSSLSQVPLILDAGEIFVDETQTDWGLNGGELVETGRRYVLLDTLVFEPGETTPKTVLARAERPGWGYNNPLPGTLNLIDQPGAGFNHDNASVRLLNYPTVPIDPSLVAHVYLDAENESDTFIPQHLGQYVQFTAGSNNGQIGRILAYFPPNISATPPTGGTAELELVNSIQSFPGNFSGTFLPGETLNLKNGATVTGFGTFLDQRVLNGTSYVTFSVQNGSAVTSIVGATSGATAQIDVNLYKNAFVAETETAAWRILGWPNDWDLTVTNPLQPVGGRLAFLDELGNERGLARAPGESDATYRRRVAEIADVVTPNAIRRQLNHVLGTIPWCFRETGSAEWPGFFFDYDAYDYDCLCFNGTPPTGTFQFDEPVELMDVTTLTPYARGYFASYNAPLFLMVRKDGAAVTGANIKIVGLRSGATFIPTAIVPNVFLVGANRYKFYFGYEDMRAFFYVGVPPLSLGEFGFAYDDYPSGAYDNIAPFNNFYDGFPRGEAFILKNLFQSLDTIKAGGVGFAIYPETGTCP